MWCCCRVCAVDPARRQYSPSRNGVATPVTVTPAAPAELALSGTNALAQTEQGTFTVTVTDQYGNLETGYTGAVTFSSSDPAALLPAGHTFTPADGGQFSFPVTFETEGSQTLTASGSGLLSATKNVEIAESP